MKKNRSRVAGCSLGFCSVFRALLVHRCAVCNKDTSSKDTSSKDTSSKDALLVHRCAVCVHLYTKNPFFYLVFVLFSLSIFVVSVFV